MNLPTDLEWTRREHEQAKRHLRRVVQERAVRNSASLDRSYMAAVERVRLTAARLAELEATQQADTLQASALNSTSLDSNSKESTHAS